MKISKLLFFLLPFQIAIHGCAPPSADFYKKGYEGLKGKPVSLTESKYYEGIETNGTTQAMLDEKKVYTFDENGNTESIALYDSDGNEVYTYKGEFKNNMPVVYTYNFGDAVSYSYFVETDDERKVWDWENRNADGEVMSTQRTTYSTFNRTSKIIMKDNDGNVISKVVSVYDKQHNCIKRVHRSTALSTNIVYVYDENDLLIEQQQTSTYSNGEEMTTVTSYEYMDFDKQGNWIRRAEHTKNPSLSSHVTIREITYR